MNNDCMDYDFEGDHLLFFFLLFKGYHVEILVKTYGDKDCQRDKEFSASNFQGQSVKYEVCQKLDLRNGPKLINKLVNHCYFQDFSSRPVAMTQYPLNP